MGKQEAPEGFKSVESTAVGNPSLSCDQDPAME